MKFYQNPTTTADSVFERMRKGKLEFLFIQRKHPPFVGEWAFPGGCLEYGKETIEECAVREDSEEVGVRVRVEDLELFGVYSDPNRDPRGHFISNAFRVKKYTGKIKAGDDADRYKWFEYDNLPKLAFDHGKILDDYMKKYHPKMRKER
jgi:ADP-ribose pyrophosphatase YjhB (NUDIX family)